MAFDGGASAAGSHPRLSLPNLKIGAILSPRAAIWLAVPTGIHREQGKPRAFEMIAPAVQLWPAEDWWLQASAGLAMDAPLIGTATKGFHLGVGAALGAGTELGRVGAFTLDAQLRTMAGSISREEGTGLGLALDGLLGASWY